MKINATIVTLNGQAPLPVELTADGSFNGYPGYAFIDLHGEYKPGAIKRVSFIKDRNELATLVNQ